LKKLVNYEHISKNSLNFCFTILFALSGVSGLIYEVVWVRQLTLILGASTYAVTIILASFMSGLGLGSLFLGRFADRLDNKKLAKWYILLELGIGFYALILPLILQLNKYLYVSFHLRYANDFDVSNILRIILSFLIFVFPTTLMGATLPIIAKYLIHSQSRVSITISRLYAVNTFGAVFGTLLAGYILLPMIGNKFTNLLAVSINFSVAALFFMLHKHLYSRKTKDMCVPAVISDGKEEKFTNIQIAVICAFTISGASAMVYEVAWTRTLVMILGTTTYAFTTMLATFLLGLAFGSMLYGQIRKFTSDIKLFIWLEIIIAFSVIISIPFFGKLPFLYLTIPERFLQNWLSLQFIRFFLAAIIMIVPTIAMGCIFPVVSAILVNKTDVLGKRIGKAYGYNTFGGVIGASLAGLVLIPSFGMQKAIIIGSFVNLLAGIIMCLLYPSATLRHRISFAFCAIIVLSVFTFMLKPWSPKIMSSGVYVYASRYRDLSNRVKDGDAQYDELKQLNSWKLWDLAMQQYTTLYYKTGQTDTVSVMERNDGIRFLTVDGKTDASSNYDHDMKTQVLLGQLPLLYHKEPDRVFVVGLGSGVTVGSILTHNVRTVDCAEYSNSVVEASKYFSEYNHNALEDKRLRIIPRDARNALMTYDKNYDVIISQPSNPWISGQSNLFSYEWYKLVDEHLSSEGIFAQWVPAYQMSEADVKIIIHTLKSVFEHITAWTSGSQGELILLAKKGSELKISYEQYIKTAENQNVCSDINRLGYNIRTLPFLTFSMNEKDIYVYLNSDCEEIRTNTDNLLFTEFSTPKQMVNGSMVNRFIKIDNLHGQMKSLIEILEDIDIDKLQVILDAS